MIKLLFYEGITIRQFLVRDIFTMIYIHTTYHLPETYVVETPIEKVFISSITIIEVLMIRYLAINHIN